MYGGAGRLLTATSIEGEEPQAEVQPPRILDQEPTWPSEPYLLKFPDPTEKTSSAEDQVFKNEWGVHFIIKLSQWVNNSEGLECVCSPLAGMQRILSTECRGIFPVGFA